MLEFQLVEVAVKNENRKEKAKENSRQNNEL